MKQEIRLRLTAEDHGHVRRVCVMVESDTSGEYANQIILDATGSGAVEIIEFATACLSISLREMIRQALVKCGVPRDYHAFNGRADRGCDLCGLPDRAAIHNNGKSL